MNATSPSHLTAPPPRRNLWPVSIIGFFGVAVVSLGTFIGYCNLHNEELVTADYYEQEVRYQGHMEQVQRTKALPGKLTLSYDAAARLIHLQFPSEAFGPATTGHVDLYRPSAGKMDRRIKIEPGNGTRQSIDSSQLSSGLWKVRVSWTTDGQDYFVEEKLALPSTGS